MTMSSLTATIGGYTYDLTDRQRYLWMQDDSLGMAPLHRILERGPNQHGETDLGFRLDPRIVNLVIGLFGTDDGDYWNARKELLKIFTPSTTPIALTFTLPNGDSRALDVHVEKDLKLSSTDRKRIAHSVGIQLRASNPTFYDPTLQSITFGIGGAAAGWSIPMPVATPVGKTSINQVKTFIYNGSFLSSPIVRITGPITDPVVTNVSTGEVLDFSGTTIVAGDYYLIDCNYGKKTVVDSSGINRYDKLSQGSDLATFHLAYHPEVIDGENDIRVSGTGINDQTEIYMAFYVRYIGI